MKYPSVTTSSSYKLISRSPLSPSPPCIGSAMLQKISHTPCLTFGHLWHALPIKGPWPQVDSLRVTKLVLGKQRRCQQHSPLLLTISLGGHYAAHASFPGNQLPNHPELQVVLSAHTPSQVYSNWRGKMHFITVTSGIKILSATRTSHLWYSRELFGVSSA